MEIISNQTCDLLLDMMMDGSEGSSVFVDSSPYNHNISIQGRPTITTGVKKFGSGSAYFPPNIYAEPAAIKINSLSKITNSDTEDFTIEFWVYLNEFNPGASNNVILGNWSYSFGGAAGYWSIGCDDPNDSASSGLFSMVVTKGGGMQYLVGHPQVINKNQWYHFALSRKNLISKIFVNGNPTPFNYNQPYQLGIDNIITEIGFSTNSNTFKGYVDEIKIIRGLALYDAAFQPPTQRTQPCIANQPTTSTPTPTITSTSTPTPTITRTASSLPSLSSTPTPQNQPSIILPGSIYSPINIKLNNIIIGDEYQIDLSAQSNLQSSIFPKSIKFIGCSTEQNISLLVNQDKQDIVVVIANTNNLTKNILNTDQFLIKCSEFDLCPTRTPTPTPFLTSTPTKTPTNTPTVTNTISATLTKTPTATNTQTPTITNTPTSTITQTPTQTSTTTQTPTPTNTCTPTQPLSCDSTIKYSGTTGTTSRIIRVGNGIGQVGITYHTNPPPPRPDCPNCGDPDLAIPDRFTIKWGSETYTTGFRGSSAYDTMLLSLGYPKTVGTGSGVLLFEKTATSPETIEVVIDSPIINSEWEFSIQCPTPVITPTPTPSNLLQCLRNWTPEDCVSKHVAPCYVDDGKLPTGPKPTGLDVKISKTIYINDTAYSYSSGTDSWVSSSGSLTIGSSSGKLDFNYGPTSYSINVPVRYRELYRDYTVVEGGVGCLSGSFNKNLSPCERINTVFTMTNNFGTSATFESNGGCDDEIIIDGQIYEEGMHIYPWGYPRCPGLSLPLNGGHFWSYNKTLPANGSITFGGRDNGIGGGFQGTWTMRTQCFENQPCNVSIKFGSSCREPDITGGCTNCINSPSVDYRTLPSYPNYVSGSIGRPIDIDIDSCTGRANPLPENFTKSNFVLYYSGGPQKPFLVIDNTAYDVRGVSGLIKIFTTSDVQEMRNTICSRLRFATLVDPTKLNTDIGAALNSNWPYNDVYWYSSCANLPNEVPINLVPC